jgi:FAD/FMN-containing dehydrogenase
VTEDFGHVLRGTAAGVVRPQTVAEVVDLLEAAVASGSAVTPRAFAHSAGGQALPDDSVVVDLTGMNSVSDVDAANGVVRCEAGVRLRDVVTATMVAGLLPRALTNLLDLSIGGLLSGSRW